MAAGHAPDAIFHGPATDYHGRDRVLPVLRALTQIVTNVRPTSMLHEADQSVASFTATVDGREADGVIRAIGEPNRPATELTLMIRPLDALLAGVEQMKEALGSDTSR